MAPDPGKVRDPDGGQSATTGVARSCDEATPDNPEGERELGALKDFHAANDRADRFDFSAD
ncbi:MAG: hypothetical protein COW54_08920 [Rhodobacteraceae bacterium CG17_big_fil_post_rev_8_21_14_2_50_63_15]|nr:MAG: hypothetical protein COW54_08920 [Rhodobacteraceae bacterium CG17_big_fil_post_rev_8_21_14_2_50_63_15]